jgi:hypothetical protein
MKPATPAVRLPERRATSPLPVVFACFILALAFLVLVGPDPPQGQFGMLLQKPDTMVWCALVAAQVALWSYLAAPAYKRAARYAAFLRSQRRSVTIEFAALLFLVGIFLYAHFRVTDGLKMPIVWPAAKVPLLVALGFATLVPCLLGMRLVAIAARAEAAIRVDTALLDRFAKLRGDLKWFLGSAAAIIATATLANGAFRNAMNKLNPQHPIPPSEVLLYGGFCSGILALFYLTSHEVFSRSGWAVVEAAEPVRDDTPGAWTEAQEKRSKLAAVMGIATSGVQAFHDGAAILAPMFGSGAALLLGTR